MQRSNHWIWKFCTGLYLQISGDDEGPLDHLRSSRPRTIGLRAVRYRSWLVPVYKAQTRFRRLRIAANPWEQQQRPFLVQIHAERWWNRLIIVPEKKEEERSLKRDPSSDVRHSGFPPFLALKSSQPLEETDSWNFCPILSLSQGEITYKETRKGKKRGKME